MRFNLIFSDCKCNADEKQIFDYYKEVINNKKEHILQILLKLRQICCHSYLLKCSHDDSTDRSADGRNNISTMFPCDGLEKSSKVLNDNLFPPRNTL